MNNIYKVIWSAAKQTYVAVNEKTGTSASRGKAVKAVVTAVGIAAAALAGAAQAEVLDTGAHDAVYYDGTYLDGFFQPSSTKFKNGLKLTEDKVLSGITGSATALYVAGGYGVTLAGENVDLGNVTRLAIIATNPKDPDTDQGSHSKTLLQIGQAEGARTTFTKKIDEIFANVTSKGLETGIASFDAEMRVDNAVVSVGTLHAGCDITFGKTADVTIDTIKVGRNAYGSVLKDDGIVNEGTLKVGSFESALDDLTAEPRPIGNGIFANRGTATIDTFSGINRIRNYADLTLKKATLSAGELTIDSKNPGGKFNDFSASLNKGTMTVEETLTLVKDAPSKSANHLTGMLKNFAEGTITVGKAAGAGEEPTGVVNNNGVIINQGAFTVNGSLNIGTDSDHAGIFINEGTLNATAADVYGILENHAGAVATFGDLDIKDAYAFDGPNKDLEFYTLRQSGNKGTIIASNLTIGALFSNDGTLKGEGENSVMTISGDAEFANTGSGTEQGRIEGFDTLSVSGTFTNYQTVSGIDQTLVNGTLYNVRADDTDNLGSFASNLLYVQENGKVVAGGDMQLGSLIVSGDLTDEDTLHTNNRPGTVKVAGSVTLQDSGTVTLETLTAGQVTMDEAFTGTFDVDNLTITGIKDAAEDTTTRLKGEATFKNLSVVEAGKLAHSDTLTVSERFTVESEVELAGELDANQLAMTDTGSLTLKADAMVDEMVKGGLITLDADTTLTVAKGDMSGTHLIFNTGSTLDYQAGAFEGATLEYRNHDQTFADGKGFGKNTVVLNNSTVTFENSSVFTNDATIELQAGSTITAGNIDFTQGDGKLVMNGGTLETSLGQIFASVDQDGKLPAVDEDGNAVDVPMGGITGVGVVKDDIKQGIEYQSGTFAFNDNGWTTGAVSSAVSNLQSAFGSGVTNATVAFKGTADANAKFDVAFIKGIQNNTNGLIFTNEVLDASGHDNLAFGTGSDEVAGNWGFKGISGVSKVTVKDGQKLILVGGETEGFKVLTDAQGNGLINATGGTLVLGMAGQKTYGELDAVNGHIVAAGGSFVVKTWGDGDVDASVKVQKGGYLSIHNMTAANNAVVVEEGGTLNLNTPQSAIKSFDNAGTVTAGTLKIDGDFHNRGMLKANKLESLNEVLMTAGTINLTGTSDDASQALLTGQALQNSGTLTLQKGGIAMTGDLANAGTIEALDGSIKADGKFTMTAGTVKTKTLEAKGGVIIEGGLVEADITQANAFVSVDGGELHADTFASDKLSIGENGTVKVGMLEEDTIIINDGMLEFTGTEDFALNKPGEFKNNKTGVVKGLKTLTFNVDGVNEGTIELKEGGKLTVGDQTTLTNSGSITGIETLDVQGTIQNDGELAVTSTTTLGELGQIVQSDDAVFSTKKLVVEGDSFDGMQGTLKVEEGISFTGDATVTVGGGSTELVLGDEGLNGQNAMTYKVSDGKVLAFGNEHGLVEKLIALNDGLKDASGYLVAEKTVTIGAKGKISLGSDPVTRAGAPNFYADGSSVTVVDASNLNDGVAFKADATAGDVTADIVEGARVVVTRVQKDGDITLLDGFTYGDKTLDASGNWIGGWTGEDAIYVNDGSGLDYEISTTYADGKLVANLQMADVSTVYADLAIKDIANAALRNGLTGGDVTLVQNVIRNDMLTVAQKTDLLNSVSQIAGTLGTNASFFADTTNLMATVEAQASQAGRDIGNTHLWVKTEGGKYKQDGLKLAGDMEAGYDTNAFGFSMGADRALSQNLRLGGAFSYLNGSAESDSLAVSGENDYDTFGLQAYAAWDATERLSLIGSMGWFHASNDMSQTSALFAGSKATAEADADAFTFGIRAETVFDAAGFSLKPYAGLRAVYMKNDAFTTHVNGEAAFRNDMDDTFTLQMPIGVAVEKAFATASGWTVAPSVDVSVIPQFGDTDYDTVVTGVGTGVSQTLNADMAGNVLGRAQFGLRAVKGQTDISVSYGFTGGDAGRADHSFMLGVGYRF